MTQGEVEATHTTPSFDESVRLHSSPVFYVAEMNVVNDLQLTTILMLEIFNESCVRSQLKQKKCLSRTFIVAEKRSAILCVSETPLKDAVITSDHSTE